MILLMYCWIWFAPLFMRNFASVFISDNSLCLCVCVCVCVCVLSLSDLVLRSCWPPKKKKKKWVRKYSCLFSVLEGFRKASYSIFFKCLWNSSVKASGPRLLLLGSVDYCLNFLTSHQSMKAFFPFMIQSGKVAL